MRIYLDACCVNRLTDDQSQERVRAEAMAIVIILREVRMGRAVWVMSDALREEIENSPLTERTRENRALLALCSDTIEDDERVMERARELQSLGYGAFDALHLASAEAGGADIVLSTDDKFVRRAARGIGAPQIPVLNPVSWLQETFQ